MSNTQRTPEVAERAGRRPWILRHRAATIAIGVVAVLLVVVAVGRGSLRIEIEPFERVVDRGQPIRIEAAVCSSSVLPITADYARPFWRITNESGEVVADSSHQLFTLELRTHTWSPRECEPVLAEDWDQREWNQRPIEPGEIEGNPRRGPQVAAGTYVVEVRWGDAPSKRTTLRIAPT